MTTDLISREAAIALLEKQKADFLSERYAADQPLSSLAERFAVDCCIEALTNMPSTESELQEEIAELQSQLEGWQYAAKYPRD